MMETEKKIELVEREYWSCSNKEHRHRTKEVAQRCIEKTRIEKIDIKRWSKEELFSLLDKKNSGENMSKLAREMRMSGSNMTRLITKAEAIRRWEMATGVDYIIDIEKRNKAIVTDVMKGETYDAVGKKYGYCRERIGQICREFIKRHDVKGKETEVMQ